MEFANNSERKPDFIIREAKRSDAEKILRLLQTAVYRHINVDWYLPGDWLGSPGFVVLADKPSSVLSQAAKLIGPRERIYGCLAVGADLESIAWVRLAAIEENSRSQEAVAAMLAQAEKNFMKKDIHKVAWLAVEDWPRPWFDAMGFTITSEIETYIKEDTAVLETKTEGIHIRPAKRSDLEILAAIEQAAFDPLWQHSLHALNLAFSQALSFDVVSYHEDIVGFQLSARSESGAHLVRMTIDPTVQGRGIGSALLAHTLNGYYQVGLTTVSLNTQIDNVSSQALYRKFGFRPSGFRLPIWLKELTHE